MLEQDPYAVLPLIERIADAIEVVIENLGQVVRLNVLKLCQYFLELLLALVEL